VFLKTSCRRHSGQARVGPSQGPLVPPVQEAGVMGQPRGQVKALSRRDKPLRRTNQVKVTLNQDELERLDELVIASGSDRASVFRSLLANSTQAAFRSSVSSPDPVKDQGFLVGSEDPSIYMAEPECFDDVPSCIDALRQGNAVTMNLTLLEPDVAQRGVDFVAGGAYALRGHQERIGESIFLFATRLNVKSIQSDEIIKSYVSEVNRELGSRSPASPPLLKEAESEFKENDVDT
jgi:cell division inhibitor SepF